MDMKLIIEVTASKVTQVMLEVVTKLMSHIPKAFIYGEELVLLSQDDMDKIPSEFIANPGKYLDGIENIERERFCIASIAYYETGVYTHPSCADICAIHIDISILMEQNVPLDVIVGILQFVQDKKNLSIKESSEFEATVNQKIEV